MATPTRADETGAMPSSPVEDPRASLVGHSDQTLTTLATLLQMLDEQWDDLDDHERRSAVRLSLDTLRR